MAGFANHDQVINALTVLGQTARLNWSKNFNPTAAAVANEWHTLFRGAGNPGSDALFNTGTNLVFNQVKETTANAGCLPHGGDMSPAYKHILAGSAVSAAGTVCPATVALIDVLGYVRVTSVTTATAQAITSAWTAFSTFAADAGTDVITHLNINLMPYTRVQLTSTTTLPAGLSAATDYYVIKVTDLTCKLASSYANAVAGTAINITDAGTGTHTINTILPRYTNGAGVQAIIFNSNATALGAATPSMTLVYTNTQGTGTRTTPAVLPVGKTAASNSHIIYTGATGAGKYNYQVPLQGGDAGISQLTSVQNSVSYVSGEYTVALIREIARFPLSTLGLAAERNFLFEMPSMPRIYDGAALYFLVGSGLATPANSNFSGHLDIVWN